MKKRVCPGVMECRQLEAGQPRPGWGQWPPLCPVVQQDDRASPITTVKEKGATPNSDVRSEAVSPQWGLGRRPRWVPLAPRCVVTVRAEMGSGPLPLSPGSGAPSYLGGPIAMNQDREGVVGQVPCSHVAHFKLEHDIIWRSESTVPSSVTPRGQAQGPTGWVRIPAFPQQPLLFM